MNIFLVTDGDYSDYHVEGVYSTRKNAELAQKLFASDNIEEYEVDDFGNAPAGMFWYEVEMDKEGNARDAKIHNAKCTIEDEWRPYGDNKVVTFYMWAKDEKHAVKIANERRIRLIESNAWTTDWNAWREDRKS